MLLQFAKSYVALYNCLYNSFSTFVATFNRSFSTPSREKHSRRIEEIHRDMSEIILGKHSALVYSRKVPTCRCSSILHFENRSYPRSRARLASRRTSLDFSRSNSNVRTYVHVRACARKFLKVSFRFPAQWPTLLLRNKVAAAKSSRGGRKSRAGIR